MARGQQSATTGPIVKRPIKITDRSRLVYGRPNLRTSDSPINYDMDVRPLPKINQVKQPIATPVKLTEDFPVVKPEPFARPAQPKLESSKVLSRQYISQPSNIAKSNKRQSRTKPPLHKMQVTLIIMAFVVFGLGLLINVQTIQTNSSAKAQVAALSKNHSEGDDDSPSEAKPSLSSYVVAPSLPKYLRISKIHVNARIKSLGVDAQNALRAPANIYDVGWYDASAKPGEAAIEGAVLLDGHVHGPTLPGVFTNLNKLSSGDQIQIVRGDDSILNYEVVKTQNYNAKEMDMSITLKSAKQGLQGLNLITCGGKYDKKTGQYEQRTVVFAVLRP